MFARQIQSQGKDKTSGQDENKSKRTSGPNLALPQLA